MKRILILALILAVAFAATPAQAREGKYAHTGSIGFWSTELSGDGSIGGQAFNLKGNGNFETKSTFNAGWIWKVGKLSDVEINYMAVENTGVINKAITINGTAFAAGANLNLKLSAFDLLGHRELSKGPKGYLDLVYGFKVIGFDVAATAGAVSNTQSFSAPLPEIGVAGEYTFNPHWNLYGALYGFSINRDNAGGTIKTFDSGVQYRFDPKHDPKADKVDWYARLGWKAQSIEGKDNADRILVDHEGATLALVGKF